MRFSKRTRGFSLIEISLVLILASLLLGMTLPSWRPLLDRERHQRLLQQLTAALQFARQQALLRHQVLGLCPSRDQRSCSDSWQGDLLVFLDPAEQGRIEEERQILRIFQLNRGEGVLHWRAFPHNRPYCQFLPSGRTGYVNGTFWYCPAGAAKPAWALVLSQSGRVRQLSPPFHVLCGGEG